MHERVTLSPRCPLRPGEAVTVWREGRRRRAVVLARGQGWVDLGPEEPDPED